MFLQIEGEDLINLELVDRVQIDRRKGLASAWSGGILLHPDSAILYQYFMNLPNEMRAPVAIVSIPSVVEQ